MKIISVEDAKRSLEFGLKILTEVWTKDLELEEIKNIFVENIAKAWMKNGQVLWPIRCALSWEEFSPWAIELVYILWIEESKNRIRRVING
jgi:hypothetical protein